MLVLRYIESFLEMLQIERSCSFNTLSSYRSDLLQFFDIYPDALAVNKVDVYVKYLHSKSYLKSTIARKIVAVKSFFIFLFQEEIIKFNYCVDLEAPKVPKRLPKAISMRELTAIFDVVYSSHDLLSIKSRAIVELLYSSALRVSELINIKIADLRFDQRNPYLCIVGKGGKERLVPLNNRVIRVLQKYILTLVRKLPGDFLFPGRNKSSPITRQAVGKIVKKLASRSGIEPSKISPHVFRHTCATHLLKNNLDIKLLKQILGHASISTTQIYTLVSQDKLYDLVKSKHPLAE